MPWPMVPAPRTAMRLIMMYARLAASTRHGATASHVQIDPDAFYLRVVLERVRAHFAPESALLVAAERGRGVVDIVGVDPHGSSLKLARDVVRLLDVAGPHSGGEAVGRVVRARDRFV